MVRDTADVARKTPAMERNAVALVRKVPAVVRNRVAVVRTVAALVPEHSEVLSPRTPKQEISAPLQTQDIRFQNYFPKRATTSSPEIPPSHSDRGKSDRTQAEHYAIFWPISSFSILVLMKFHEIL